MAELAAPLTWEVVKPALDPDVLITVVDSVAKVVVATFKPDAMELKKDEVTVVDIDPPLALATVTLMVNEAYTTEAKVAVEDVVMEVMADTKLEPAVVKAAVATVSAALAKAVKAAAEVEATAALIRVDMEDAVADKMDVVVVAEAIVEAKDENVDAWEAADVADMEDMATVAKVSWDTAAVATGSTTANPVPDVVDSFPLTDTTVSSDTDELPKIVVVMLETVTEEDVALAVTYLRAT